MDRARRNQVRLARVMEFDTLFADKHTQLRLAQFSHAYAVERTAFCLPSLVRDEGFVVF